MTLINQLQALIAGRLIRLEFPDFPKEFIEYDPNGSGYVISDVSEDYRLAITEQARAAAEAVAECLDQVGVYNNEDPEHYPPYLATLEDAGSKVDDYEPVYRLITPKEQP